MTSLSMDAARGPGAVAENLVSSCVTARSGDRYFVDIEHAAQKRFYPREQGRGGDDVKLRLLMCLPFFSYHHILFLTFEAELLTIQSHS